MNRGKTYGQPLKCPKCPSKHYFGVLKGQEIPTELVRLGRSDVCPNCHTALIKPDRIHP